MKELTSHINYTITLNGIDYRREEIDDSIFWSAYDGISRYIIVDNKLRKELNIEFKKKLKTHKRKLKLERLTK